MHFFPLVYGYPSYLGVDIFEVDEKYFPEFLLGFTNGKKIVIRKNLGELKDFVLFHEEEHVKDMFASEKEIDERALRRLILKNKIDDKKRRKIRELLNKRWKLLSKNMQANFEIPIKYTESSYHEFNNELFERIDTNF